MTRIQKMTNDYPKTTNVYRYGFNGKESDDEIKGEGNQQDYGMRIYDTRLGRFLSVDPLECDRWRQRGACRSQRKTSTWSTRFDYKTKRSS